jgi:DNA-binding transcriptional MerR regulator
VQFEDNMAMTVGELSRISGVTVRTLHHYDEIGLVVPSQRTSANYRLYSDEDVLRLQQVLVFRELGISLDEIAGLLDDATHANRADLLRRHRDALAEKRGKLDAMLAAVDHAIDVLEKGTQMMTSDDFKKMFDGFDPAEYEEEAQQRWGNTDAYKESNRRVKNYGKGEWEQIGKEAAAINTRFIELMREGAAPSDPRVQAVVEEHRAHISKWFYDCTKQIHRGLGEMYVADPRFTKNIDKAGAGLAKFMSDAIAAS